MNYPGGSPFPVTLSSNVQFPTNGGWVVIPPNVPAVYVNQWNLSFQRQIGTNWLITANYNGLFLTVQRNMGTGFILQGNYTFSHCINTGTQQLISIPIIAGISPVPAREGLRGNCSILEVDRRHNFNLSAVYLTPKLSNRSLRSIPA